MGADLKLFYRIATILAGFGNGKTAIDPNQLIFLVPP
jgi:hypothetical protein